MLSGATLSLTPGSLAWVPQGGGVTVNYQYQPGRPASTTGATIDFYWASGTTVATEIGKPVARTAVTSASSHAPITVSAAALGAAPQGAKDLLAVADTGSPSPSTAANQVLALAYDPITANSATAPTSQTIALTYTISEAAPTSGQTITVGVYRSASPQFSPGSAILVNTLSIPSADSAGHAGSALGTHTINLQDPAALLPDPRHEYVYVVVDPSHKIGDPQGTVHEAHFRKFVLGVLSHGFRGLGQITGIPAWEPQTAKDLQTIDGYNQVIQFDWTATSNLPEPGLAVAAGNQLYSQVVSTADALVRSNGHPGDVVDLHLIGHSRGAVVISQVLQDLVGTTDPALAGGYKVMTVLDPHPASIAFNNPGYSAGTGIAAAAAVAVLIAGEKQIQDPQVLIPSNVDAVQDYFQHTQASVLSGTLDPEAILNPWGEDPSLLINRSAARVVSVDLTNRFDPVIGPIGHVQVPVWYDQHVVQQGGIFPGYQA
jgi:hypothetical protein